MNRYTHIDCKVKDKMQAGYFNENASMRKGKNRMINNDDDHIKKAMMIFLLT